jgi:hypothetical protein
MFFVNFHAEARSFLPAEALAFETVATNAIYAGLLGQAAADAAAPETKTKTEYGLQTTFELEPHAKFTLSGDTSVSLGVPFTYDMSGENKVTYNGTSTTDDATSVLSVGPNVSFFTVIGLPVEVELQYVMPLMGKLF